MDASNALSQNSALTQKIPMVELEALITLNQLPKIGPVRIRNLISFFGDALSVLEAPLSQLKEVEQCGGKAAEIIANWKRHTNTPRELELCERFDIQVITPESCSWPRNLNGSKDTPVLLYVKGSIQENDQNPIAVIGSRKTTHYGRAITEEFSTQLSYSGRTIISGLALGIDTIAHQSAIHAGERTIGVLGSGLGVMYPKENTELAETISAQGAIISEFPITTQPDRQTFPQRNRIVAAWADATLVTEMPERSGAMITAQFARDIGRPVFAVPGPIDRPSSAGCHKLIREGASLVTNASQIIQELRPAEPEQFSLEFTASAPSPQTTKLTKEELQILNNLHSQEQSVEDIHIQTQIPIAQLTSILLTLELHDLAIQHQGMTYTKS